MGEKNAHGEIRLHVEEIWRPVHAASWMCVGQADVVVVDAHVLAVHAVSRAESEALIREWEGRVEHARLNGRIRHRTKDALADPLVNLGVLGALLVERSHAVGDSLPHLVLGF